MSLRLKMALLLVVLVGALLGLALAVDAWLVTPWIATLVPDPDAGQRDALFRGLVARRTALAWVAGAALLMGFRLADRHLSRPLMRLAAEVSRRRVSGPAWAEATPQRIDEIGVIAREFGQTYDELKALRGSAARADALRAQLERMGGIDFAVRRLAVAVRRLGVAMAAGEDELEPRLRALTDEVTALHALTRSAGATAETHAERSGSEGVSPASAPAPESPAAPAASLPGRLPEAELC